MIDSLPDRPLPVSTVESLMDDTDGEAIDDDGTGVVPVTILETSSGPVVPGLVVATTDSLVGLGFDDDGGEWVEVDRESKEHGPDALHNMQMAIKDWLEKRNPDAEHQHHEVEP